VTAINLTSKPRVIIKISPSGRNDNKTIWTFYESSISGLQENFLFFRNDPP